MGHTIYRQTFWLWRNAPGACGAAPVAGRAPYFHNGAADSIDEVISFSDRRFHIGLTAQEIADLKAFLQST